MAHYYGLFYGYREWLGSRIGRLMLELWELDGKIPHTLEVFEGDAGDAWSAMYSFGGQSVIVLVMAWDASALFELSEDGSTYLDETEVDPDKEMGGFVRRFAARGFRVKNKTAGLTARYQFVAFR